MRIGVDLDDTICRTTEIVHDRLEKYAESVNLNPLDIMNDDELKQQFFNIYLEDIYTNVVIKRDVKKVLKRIRNRGNEIYIITARGSDNIPSKIDVEKITREWLEQNEIEVDGIIINAYGEKKAEVCKENKIALMIDDDPYNYKMIISKNINTLLFDDRERYDLRDNYITSWIDIEKYIERNR